MSTAETPKQTKKKKPKKSRKHIDHPKYLDMIIEAIQTMQDKRGSSRQSIVKYIHSNFKITESDENADNYVKNALRMGVKYERLKLARGQGVSGSFRVNEPKPSSRREGARNPERVGETAKSPTKGKRKAKARRPTVSVKATAKVPVKATAKTTKAKEAKTKGPKKGSKGKQKKAKKKGRKV